MADAMEVNMNDALLAEANNQLAILLHEKLAREQKNLFFSPFSISMAMAMLFRGAKDDTLDEMRKVLGFHSENLVNEVHKTFGKLLKILNEKQDSYILAVANALVSQKGFQLLPEFKSDLQEFYQALTIEVDFMGDSAGAVKQVNDWVKKNTRNLIPKLVNSLNPATVLVLLNAVYFKGTWAHQFDPKNTRRGVFYNKGRKKEEKKVPMMFRKGKYLFIQKEKYKALEMPYKGGDIAMLLLLPNDMNGLEELEKHIGSTFVKSLREDMCTVEVEVTVPKLHLEYSKDLESVFQELGLNKVFSCEANFRGLINSGQLAVSKIIHKALLDVNEEGSEAAAATAIVMMRCRLAIPHVFRADHPFLFVIYDKRNNMIIFMGHVEEM